VNKLKQSVRLASSHVQRRSNNPLCFTPFPIIKPCVLLHNNNNSNNNNNKYFWGLITFKIVRDDVPLNDVKLDLKLGRVRPVNSHTAGGDNSKQDTCIQHILISADSMQAPSAASKLCTEIRLKEEYIALIMHYLIQNLSLRSRNKCYFQVYTSNLRTYLFTQINPYRVWLWHKRFSLNCLLFSFLTVKSAFPYNFSQGKLGHL